MKKTALLITIFCFSSCEPPEGVPPESIRGTWTGDCITSGSPSESFDLRVEISDAKPPVVVLGGASLRDGKYQDCAGYAVSTCDIVLDGKLEGQIGSDWNENYTEFSAFVSEDGDTIRTDITVMEFGAIFAPEFMCNGNGLIFQ